MAIEQSDSALHTGIVTNNGAGMLDFYAHVLGLETSGEVHFPGLGVVNKFQCGHSQLKILVLEQPAKATSPAGGFSAATGLRYLSMNIANIVQVVEDCKRSGCSIPVDVKEIRPGVRAAMVEDPDGNTIEFMQVD